MNIIIKSVCEILGEPKDTGGYFLPYENGVTIPILLNKDKNAEYPEIRVSPFIQNADAFTQRFYEKTLREYDEYKYARFQIDVFSKDLIEVNHIYEKLKDRVYDFTNLEVLKYNADVNGFVKENDYYKNIAYGLGDLFIDIYHIDIKNKQLKRVASLNDLEIDNFFVDDTALYIKTNDDISDVQVNVITQGRLFNNKDSLSNRGIQFIDLNDARNLSELAVNEVERISFDMDILFSRKRVRDKLPNVDRIRQSYTTK